MPYIISGAWNIIKIVCGGEQHNEPAEMDLEGNHSKEFRFVCQEDDCQNSIRLADYEKILEQISNEIVKNELAGEALCLTNKKFTLRSGVRCKVLEHTEQTIKIAVYNPQKIKKYFKGT